MSIPYETATSGEKALTETQRILAKFGCSVFGTMTDAERGVTIVQFKWRDRQISLEASWKGYASAWLKEHPYSHSYSRISSTAHNEKAMKQAKTSVCSVLRDWVKGQVTAIECGVISFEEAFMPYILLPTGERVIDRIKQDKLLPAPEEKVRAIK